jgi:hypothetical protein
VFVHAHIYVHGTVPFERHFRLEFDYCTLKKRKSQNSLQNKQYHGCLAFLQRAVTHAIEHSLQQKAREVGKFSNKCDTLDGMSEL